MDLPYIYSTEGVIKEPNLLAEAGQGILGAGMSYMRYVDLFCESKCWLNLGHRGDIGGALSGVFR